MHERTDWNLPADTVGRENEWDDLVSFATSHVDHATLGMVWGRRRIGKSYLLTELCSGGRGLYYEAKRGSETEALAEIGAAVGSQIGAPGPVELADWDEAVSALMRLSAKEPFVVVLDEYPYLREESPDLDSVIQRAFGPRSALRNDTQCRLILCGSAISVMTGLLSGSAPLRGRAGLDLRLAPFDYRDALDLYGTDDLNLAMRLYSIIGGVAAYARDMVDDDLPASMQDLDQWVVRRVLSPSAPLSREAEFLLAEDPATATARRINLYHATLAAVATGRTTPGKIADYVKIAGPGLNPILQTLVAARFIERVSDPIRQNRPTYLPGDPIIRFHYSIIRPNHTALSHHGGGGAGLWERVQPTFGSNVVGPTFETMARHWIAQYSTIPGVGDPGRHVGSTTVHVDDKEREVDLVVAADDSEVPGERSVVALGEATSGRELTFTDLNRLEAIRAALGNRAADAICVLVGSRFATDLVRESTRRTDVEIIDLERLYHGS